MRSKKGNRFVASISILSTILLILLVLFGDAWFFNGVCSNEEAVFSLNIEGTLLNKYEDQNNHLNNTLEITNNKETITIILSGDISGLYDYLLVGDSITKEKESLDCFVRRDKETKSFHVDFGCEN